MGLSINTCLLHFLIVFALIPTTTFLMELFFFWFSFPSFAWCNIYLSARCPFVFLHAISVQRVCKDQYLQSYKFSNLWNWSLPGKYIDTTQTIHQIYIYIYTLKDRWIDRYIFSPLTSVNADLLLHRQWRKLSEFNSLFRQKNDYIFFFKTQIEVFKVCL